ncbi:MAG TPA: S8 family serine peptidase [Solirubrobacteraceae bacterium]
MKPRLAGVGAALALAAVPGGLALAPASARALDYAPNEVVVGYAPGSSRAAHATVARAAAARSSRMVEGQTQVLRLAPGTTVAQALARLRRQPNVRFAVPDYIAHASELAPPAPFTPNNPGDTGMPGGWAQVQWNFSGPFGVGAPQAWGNLIADHAPGGSGVVVAVIDTGVAYRNVGRFRRSPGFYRSQFVKGRDFIDPGHYPVDHNGHGTFVAGEIAEAANNGYGLPGLAYGVRLMPIRALDSEGEGDASIIAQGVRYAVNHGAEVINLSLEFQSAIHAADIPELIRALAYARRRGVVVVAAAGNEGRRSVAYPARARDVISVGATTEHGCLASYSNDGRGLTLVAPGGGADADLAGDPNCHPLLLPGRSIYQVTFIGSSPRRFGLPSGYEGTSMAAPEVAATAALVIASGVLGKHPSPTAVRARLTGTATPLGASGDRTLYGAGLLNAAAATAGAAQLSSSSR